mmetsp:Transcript_31841/g.99993  ORF Transcript_31841/g.99993 Transcript_31841/m.99993 type:complete len:202 (-) Transcript_31841:185-790(-)
MDMSPLRSSRSLATCLRIAPICWFWSASTARSMLRASPCIRATPLTSRAAFRLPDPSLTRSKSMSGSRAKRLTSQSMDASHCLTTGSTTISRNSSLSKMPFLSSSAASKSRVIFAVWVLICLCFVLIMMVSSVAATLKVSCKKTPVMTMTTAKPMMNLWTRAKMRNHSLTVSVRARQTGIQLASVISNIVSMALLNVPKYL